MAVVRLNSQDEYFLDTDTATAPTHVGGLEIFSLPKGAGRHYVQELYAYLRSSPVRAEPFNYRLATIEPEAGRGSGSLLTRLRSGLGGRKQGKPVRVWSRLRKVNVDEHIYLHALPRPGGQRELGELVARLHVNRLERSRPLWESHLIEGLEGGRFAVYTKLHHSQFDGKRGMNLNQYVRSTSPSTRGLPPIWAVDLKRAGPPRRAPRRTAVAEPSAFEQLVSWGTVLRQAAEARSNKPGEGVIAPYSAPATILNGPLTARRRLGTQSLPMKRLRAIGAAVPGGATINEVLLAVCGGALRRYLLEQDALPKEPLIAACPVAQARKEDSAAGNAVGQILVSLGTHIPDPKRRLLAVVESSRANKALIREMDVDTFTNYNKLSMIPQVLAARTPFGHKVLNANLVISNVPGPSETQYVNGARLEAMYATSLLLAGQALNITVCNFGDNLDMGVLACPDLCPSPQKIAVYAGEELGVLERALGLAAAGPGRRRRATRAAADTSPRAVAVRRAKSAPATPARKRAGPRAAKAAGRPGRPPDTTGPGR